MDPQEDSRGYKKNLLLRQPSFFFLNELQN